MQTGLGRLTVHAVRMVVSQFGIFAAVRRRASRLRFPERRPAVRPLFPRARPLHGPATARFRTFRAALTSRWTSILQCAHRWIRTERSFGTVRPHCEHSCEVFLALTTANLPLALSAL